VRRDGPGDARGPRTHARRREPTRPPARRGRARLLRLALPGFADAKERTARHADFEGRAHIPCLDQRLRSDLKAVAVVDRQPGRQLLKVRVHLWSTRPARGVDGQLTQLSCRVIDQAVGRHRLRPPSCGLAGRSSQGSTSNGDPSTGSHNRISSIVEGSLPRSSSLRQESSPAFRGPGRRTAGISDSQGTRRQQEQWNTIV